MIVPTTAETPMNGSSALRSRQVSRSSPPCGGEATSTRARRSSQRVSTLTSTSPRISTPMIAVIIGTPSDNASVPRDSRA